MEFSLQFKPESRTLPLAVEMEAWRPSSALQLACHGLRSNRVKLRREWVRRILRACLLSGFDRRRIVVMADSMYAGYVEALIRGGLNGLRVFLHHLPQHLALPGIGGRDALLLADLLRSVIGRSLVRRFRRYQGRRPESRTRLPPAAGGWPRP